MRKYSMLDSWLGRTSALASFLDLEKTPVEHTLTGWLALDTVVAPHESAALPAESLESSWSKTDTYVRESLRIINSDVPCWLDSEEVEMIREQLGSPPPLCYPLYMLSVGSDADERLVYVGKTSSQHPRFRNGHAALTKLHDPKYDGKMKRLYLGAIVLLDHDDYRALEWVHPIDQALRVLSSVEAQLIHHFRPELNTQHVQSDNSRWNMTLHIQNATGATKFLDDYIFA